MQGNHYNTTDPIGQIERFLHQYALAFNLEEWGKPNFGICLKVFTALNGRDLDDLANFLVKQYHMRNRPWRGYYWFVSLVRDEFMEKVDVGFERPEVQAGT